MITRPEDQQPELRPYRVDAAAFFAGVEEGEESFVPRQMALRCRGAMEGLIERYALDGSEVLSLGSAEAFEEFWLFKASCRLTLNDIDTTGAFARYLERLSSAPTSGAALTYLIGDAARIDARHLPAGGCDLLYVSSFHPDEIRREEVRKRYEATRPLSQTLRLWTWPRGEVPYHATLTDAAVLLRKGGLAIFQHYRGGVNIAANPHYLTDVHHQFSAHGLSLLEVYAFRQLPAVLLVVALKGSGAEAARRVEELSGRPAIREFFGRFLGDERKDVIQVFRAGRFGMRARIALFIWRVTWLAVRLVRGRRLARS